MLKLSQVAERLNCSLANVYALKDQGLLEVTAVGASGKGFRVSQEALAAYIESRRHGRRQAEWSDRCKPIKLKHLR